MLKQNVIVLIQLEKYYSSISSRKGVPEDLVDKCKDEIDHFKLRLDGLGNDIQIQILRLEALLCLLENRKSLVKQVMQSKLSLELSKNQLHSIPNYQNSQINRYSTKSMVTMTEDMNDIARKTKIEINLMKVITPVTLFFLPGAFISVGRIPLSVSLVKCCASAIHSCLLIVS